MRGFGWFGTNSPSMPISLVWWSSIVGFGASFHFTGFEAMIFFALEVYGVESKEMLLPSHNARRVIQSKDEATDELYFLDALEVMLKRRGIPPFVTQEPR